MKINKGKHKLKQRARLHTLTLFFVTMLLVGFVGFAVSDMPQSQFEEHIPFGVVEDTDDSSVRKIEAKRPGGGVGELYVDFEKENLVVCDTAKDGLISLYIPHDSEAFKFLNWTDLRIRQKILPSRTGRAFAYK